MELDGSDANNKIRLAMVAGRLRQEYVAAGKEDLFEELKGYILWTGPARSDEEFQKELNLSYGALRVAVHRLRRRFGELVHEEFGSDDSNGLERV